jgi:exodeoxyribonuclease-5
MIDAKALDADGLYPQQRQAVDAMTKWLNSDSLEFTLSGYAGTGKTFVTSVFLKTAGRSANYCVTAPTHKALRVVERQLNAKGKTLHALHGLRLNVDLLNFDIENPQFDPRGTPHIQNYKLIVADEASMINSGLFELNRRASKEYNTKLLLCGDPLQLPPVNELVGKAFTDVPNRFNLTDIVRQSGDNDLLYLFDMLRDDIIKGTSNCVTHLIKSRDKDVAKNYKVLSINNYRNEILSYFDSPEFTKNVDYIRQACFSRAAVAKWNKEIRARIIGKNKDLVDINDILTAYVNQVDSFRMPIITNSNDYLIYDIENYINDLGIKTFAVNLTDIVNGKNTPKLLILDHTHKPSVDVMLKMLNVFHYNAAIKREPGGFKAYYNFKNSILIMKDLVLDPVNHSKTVNKDIDYGYALTIHKLQGSTLKNVAVDLYDILYPSEFSNRITDVDTRNRLLYVALSRATDNAIIRY